MSIASEISRLQTAKADIKTAIEAKGVTVPSNAKLDDYDTYVGQIQTGGGGTNYLEQYANKGLLGTVNSTQLGTNIGSTMTEYFLFNQRITSVDLTGTGTTTIGGWFCNNCQFLTSVTIPSTVARIGVNFLANCPNITSFTIPSTVNYIDSYCLDACANLTQVTVNATITTLPQYFCRFCPLTLVDLNSSVSAISKADFQAGDTSTNLLEVVLRKTDGIVTLPYEIGYNGVSAAFRYRQNIKIYVPRALISSYQADTKWAKGVTLGYLTIVALEDSQYE